MELWGLHISVMSACRDDSRTPGRLIVQSVCNCKLMKRFHPAEAWLHEGCGLSTAPQEGRAPRARPCALGHHCCPWEVANTNLKGADLDAPAGGDRAFLPPQACGGIPDFHA